MFFLRLRVGSEVPSDSDCQHWQCLSLAGRAVLSLALRTFSLPSSDSKPEVSRCLRSALRRGVHIAFIWL